MTNRMTDIRDLPVLAKESTARFASLAALCLSYGGPDGSDWGELLAWIEGRLGPKTDGTWPRPAPKSAEDDGSFDFDEGPI